MAEVVADSSSKDRRWSLHGMTALVTGGTKGIGHAIVEELAGFGARVHTCSRTETELNKCLLEWRAKGFQVTGSVCDVTSQAQREKLLNTVSSEFNGKLNILINNVGTYVPKPNSELTAGEVSLLIDTNLLAAHNLSLLAHPLVKASGAGSIVFISSIHGVVPELTSSIYGAMNGATNHLTRHLACEWAGDNIRVNAVAPVLIRTRLTEFAFEDENAIKVFASQIPLGRISEAKEISAVVAFLCLPAASYVTGQIINVDGGVSLNGMHFPSNTS